MVKHTFIRAVVLSDHSGSFFKAHVAYYDNAYSRLGSQDWFTLASARTYLEQEGFQRDTALSDIASEWWVKEYKAK